MQYSESEKYFIVKFIVYTHVCKLKYTHNTYSQLEFARRAVGC